MQFLQGFQCQLFFPNWTSRATSHQPSPRLIHLRTHALELQMKAGLQTLTSRTCILDPSPKKWWNQKSLQLSYYNKWCRPISELFFLHISLYKLVTPTSWPEGDVGDPGSCRFQRLLLQRLVVQVGGSALWKGWNMMELLWIEFPSTNQAWPPTTMITMGSPVWSNHITLPCILTSPKYHAERDVNKLLQHPSSLKHINVMVSVSL